MAKTSKNRIVVIFSTHNGKDVIPDVLKGYANITTPVDQWRLVVVDNASNDETGKILEDFSTLLPITILHEPVPGKNIALNKALDAVGLDYDLYVFTDDDAVPDADFIQEWMNVADDRQQYDLFGGTVRLLFRETPPKWLSGRFSPYFEELYAQNERADGEIVPDLIYGPNMAVRGSIIAAGHRFNEDIGPNSRNPVYAMGSENQFCVSASRERGAKSWFASGPKVSHIVRPWQTTLAFVGQRAYRHGRGVAMRQVLASPDGRISPPSLKGAVVQFARALGRRIFPSGGGLWQYHWHRGYRDWVRNHLLELKKKAAE